ncbi:M protein repeat protein [Talaromyces stipitatus ATCC 10500]|uniref:M protein repeat protein n=1 Tax=Talaromyces stipitatus (strain ATCC 10500 / CBS 375.48 / QM 6759 / NRRL 1006) TaxID=441959 RepID=B8LW84_TALSN|nr:M protein repeat protein [Talaromyces stipitatus ATCC 10500]EED24112.1 M protein repeat protein [Talaromyces stipitatus ATCC 10500]
MTSNSQQAKSRWGVGALLQQAVSGVESRLDTILANDDETPKSSAPKADDAASKSSLTATKAATGVTRTSSTARKNDRLQERLARAVAKSQTPTMSSSPRSSVEVLSRSSTPLQNTEMRTSMDNTRTSLDQSVSASRNNEAVTVTVTRDSLDSGSQPRSSKELSVVEHISDSSNQEVGNGVQEIIESQITDESVNHGTFDTSDILLQPEHLDSPLDGPLEELRAEHKATESRWQEEMHEYIERIDALQSKLKYLAKEAADSARDAASAAKPGSIEKQLAEKDERIALLLEEGQKLSKTELDNRTVIKKLRQQLAESNKQEIELKRRTAKLERDASEAEARAKRAEASEKKAQENLDSQSRASKDLDSITSERDALKSTVEELKSQLARAVSRAEAAESKAQAEVVEHSKRRITELEDDLSSAKIERELSEEKLRREIRSLQDNLEREKENARLLEAELKSEQSVLESKMESLRSRAEEVSSSTAGETQAKLLRQIETLQTQYAVASENWQGIESSLLSRLNGMEKERDEIARKEADLRRKAREVNIKAKKAEDELDTAKETIENLDHSLLETKQQLQKLQQRVEKSEEELNAVRKELADKEKSTEAFWTQKLEEERARWRDQVSSPPPFLQEPRTVSPVASSRRSTGLDPLTIDSRPLSRRSSTLPSQVDMGAPSRTNSFPSFQGMGSPHASQGLLNPNLLGAPPIHNLEPDEFYSGTPATPSAFGAQTSHSRGNGINEIISVSTVGAGPSVQLVERMSATVRRLESERAATKDELERITAQRDEARKEVVELMRESEEKRKAESRIEELESQVAELDQRYQTTLELLGEKSEQVDELQADIADLKKIYRELVDSTMK